MKSSGATLRVLAKRAMNLAVGDVVELVTSDGDRLPDARVEKLRADVPITPEERHLLRQPWMDHDLRTTSGKALVSGFEVTLDRTATLPRGSFPVFSYLLIVGGSNRVQPARYRSRTSSSAT